jgi:hypothetical protein
MLARIRKAIVAALLAGAGAVTASLMQSATEGVINRDEVLKALGAGLALAIVTLAAVYKTENIGDDIDPNTGSERKSTRDTY